ncbi:hypothetical protein KMW28_12670 [Flammeovirga yaeyamensis]|uniref:Uncharacterized protein n=1 Tax=Flammeovirga yaeyamensis TaxID=367791 RepID=A0AAX1N2C5_9BACT|nr:hypothetical protein [Flammeovirga yaeyamensis]MBB3695978.1 hypothetical protein [Flammeovirga yaeyamensis]NMF34664.1 hypothetical protein [Flammeovirga yaeyamensis]QWG00506.1 hypothetical protein KMW28_12670 [Flammeovirga yaeyamensis]
MKQNFKIVTKVTFYKAVSDLEKKGYEVYDTNRTQYSYYYVRIAKLHNHDEEFGAIGHGKYWLDDDYVNRLLNMK